MSATDETVDVIARELTGYIGAGCCHKTGGVSSRPDCICRQAARAVIAALSSTAVDDSDGTNSAVNRGPFIKGGAGGDL